MKSLLILTTLALTGSFPVCGAQSTLDEPPRTLWSAVDGNWVQNAYLGLIYRYTVTGRLNWTLDWLEGMSWPFQVHGLRMRSVGLGSAIKF